MRVSVSTRAPSSNFAKNSAKMVFHFSSNGAPSLFHLQFMHAVAKPHIQLLRALSGDPRAEKVFLKDYEDTYTVMAKRAAKAVEEDRSAGREQIQLVPENESTTISFNVPDGPPPEHIILEGPGTEGLDPEEVRKALQLRWEVFEGFEKDFREALKSGELEKVNEVLGRMEVADAERVVELLNIGGIMSFAEGGVRDATGEV
jgi:cell division cycle protein 37